MRFKASTVIAVFVAGVAGVGAAHAGDSKCVRCGSRDACQQICRLVDDERKVEVACWGTKCEDFVVPGPSKRGCEHCEIVCDSCDEASGVHATPKKMVWTEWFPTRAKAYTKRKLMKKTVVQKVPSHKWVIENLCTGCEASVESAEISPGAQVPPPPRGADKMKYPASASAKPNGVTK